MQPSLSIPLAVLVLAATHVLGAPGAVLRGRYVPSMAPGSSPEQTQHHGGMQDMPPPDSHGKTLPGVNHKPIVRPAATNGTTAAGTSKHLPAIADDEAVVFGHKCRQPTLLGGGKKGRSTLQAACRDDGEGEEEGIWWLTSLNLNTCLGNDGGNLVFQERGNYDATCRPCGIETLIGGHVLLRCACEPGPGRASAFTELALDRHDGGLGITAVNGRLVCGSHRGTKSPQFGETSGSAV